MKLKLKTLNKNIAGVETTMIYQPIMSDPSVETRLINNLRCARQDMEEIDIQLEEIITKFDELLDKQRAKRIQSKQQL